MKHINFKTIYPHIIAVVIFLLLTIIYFKPIFFDGKSLPQGDMIGSAGMAKEVVDYHEQTGDYAMWTNSMFGGMPTTSFYGEPSFNIFQKIANGSRLGLPYLTAGILFLYMLGFYIMMLCFGIKPWLAIVGAIAYGFGSYNLIVISAGHVSKAYAMAAIAPVLGGIVRTLKGHRISGLVITLIALGIQIGSNHIQITYYTMLAVIIIGIVYFIYSYKEKEIKKFLVSGALLIAMAVLALLPNVVNIFPSLEYSKDTMRGGHILEAADGEKESPGLNIEYAYMWSYGKSETFSLMIPDIHGGGSADHRYMDNAKNRMQALQTARSQPPQQFVSQYIGGSYWGDQPFTDGPVYFGAIICFLFVLGLFIVKGPEKWWILAVTILSIMMSWGRNLMWFNEFLFYNLPKYSMFRTPSMALVLANVTMILMAVLALREIFEKRIPKQKLLKSLYISGGITAGLCFIFAVMPHSFFSFVSDSDERLKMQFASIFTENMQNAWVTDRAAMLTSDAWRSLIYIGLAFVALYLFITRKIKDIYIIGVIGILVLSDLWTVDKRYLNENSFQNKRKNSAVITPTKANMAILQDKGLNYRVLNLASSTFNESQTSYFHKSVGGYSPAKMQRYQDLIDHHISKDINYFIEKLRTISSTAEVGNILADCKILNMLNARYIIYNNDIDPIYNANALGNAWFVQDLKWVSTPNEEIDALHNLDFEKEVVVHKDFENMLTSVNFEFDPEANIELTNYTPKYLAYKAKASTPQLAIFSEIFYDKGWTAYIDGVEVPHFRTNYTFRGLTVPEGEHLIEFKYYPKTYYACRRISSISSIFIVLLLLGCAFWRLKENGVIGAQK